MKSESNDRLRTGFSTGTAMVAAALAALRRWFGKEAPTAVAVKLPVGYYYPVAVRASRLEPADAVAVVEKDGGDDPDVTHKALIQVRLRCRLEAKQPAAEPPAEGAYGPGIELIAGVGVGRVSKPGLPVLPGEPAINPGPRHMLLANLAEEFQRCWLERARSVPLPFASGRLGGSNRVHLPWPRSAGPWAERLGVDLEVSVPAGDKLAGRTLNPRLGILGGISILGTTGLVKPFSHEAYEQTIIAALRVAAAGGCREAVLSTGGKSEKAARQVLSDRPLEAFVQIADFFAFAVDQSVRLGFQRIVHSVFFGKAVKMAAGHAYTHAHRVSLEPAPIVAAARSCGCGASFCRQLAEANTARHALEMLLHQGAHQVIQKVAVQAAANSAALAEGRAAVRLLLWDYSGSLLADVSAAR